MGQTHWGLSLTHNEDIKPSAAVRSLCGCGKYYVPIPSVDWRRQRGLSAQQDRAMPCARFTAQQFSIFASNHLSDENQTFSVADAIQHNDTLGLVAKRYLKSNCAERCGEAAMD